MTTRVTKTSAMTRTFQGTMVSTQRKDNSASGNPCFEVTIETASEGEIVFNSKPDAAVGYDLLNVHSRDDKSLLQWVIEKGQLTYVRTLDGGLYS